MPRLGRYIHHCGGDKAAAWRMYRWNLEVSAAFYEPLHCLEVGVRNALNVQMLNAYGVSNWWTVAPLDAGALRLVQKAQAKLTRGRARDGKRCVDDDLIAELTFGFWAALIATRYDRAFWIPTLRHAFPFLDESRKELHHRLESAVLFRNRIMHYEPIFHRDLAADFRKIVRVVGYIDQDAAVALKQADRLSVLLAGRPSAGESRS